MKKTNSIFCIKLIVRFYYIFGIFLTLEGRLSENVQEQDIKTKTWDPEPYIKTNMTSRSIFQDTINNV